MSYRLRAIRGIRHAIADCEYISATNPTNFTLESANALMATCYVLLAQSAFLDDGLTDFMTFLRGLMSIGTEIYRRNIRLLLRNAWGYHQLRVVLPHTDEFAPLTPQQAEEAQLALRGLQGLCSNPVQKKFAKILERVAIDLERSGKSGKWCHRVQRPCCQILTFVRKLMNLSAIITDGG